MSSWAPFTGPSGAECHTPLSAKSKLLFATVTAARTLAAEPLTLVRITLMPISKRDLVDDLLAAHSELNRKQATAFVTDLLATVAAGLKRGESVRFAGFGSFNVRERAARTVKPPKGGEVQVPAHKTVTFKPARALRSAVNAAKKKKPAAG